MEGPIRNLPPDSPARGSSSMPDCSSTPVDPRWTGGDYLLGGEGRGPCYACQGEDVDADVEQGPAPKVGVEEPPLGVDVGAEAQVGLHHAEFAHSALGDQLAGAGNGGDEARRHGLHVEQLPPARRLDHPPRLGGVDGEGLSRTGPPSGRLQLPPRARPPLQPGKRQRPAPARLRHAFR